MARRRLDSAAAFSLVELLVVMLIAGVVGTAVVRAVSSVARAEQVALDLRQNTDAARIAVERLRDPIRNGFGVCNGSDDSTLTFWQRDLDENDRVDEEELVTISFDDGRLMRTDGLGSPQQLAFGIAEGAEFSYLDGVGAPAAVPVATGIDCDSTEVIEGRGEVGTIQIRMAGEQRTDGRPSPTSVDTQITLRNAAQQDGLLNPNRPPIASFTYTCTGRTCSFDAGESYDEDGDIVSYSWDFGHGGTTATGVTATHTFPADETYSVRLTVTDDEGATTTLPQWVSLASGNATPSAELTVSCEGLTCTVDGSGSWTANGLIVDYHWDFGDGNEANGSTLLATSHTYATPGTFPVTLTVTSNNGLYGTEIVTANPTADTGTVYIVSIEPTSTWQGNENSGNWTPSVRITAKYGDGAPANGVRINGRFGPLDSTDLRSGNTNPEGRVALTANKHLSASSHQFTILSVDGHTLATSPNNTIILTPPS